jgi:hypothetical protein
MQKALTKEPGEAVSKAKGINKCFLYGSELFCMITTTIK